jgi:outer membrane immunogenic protein
MRKLAIILLASAAAVPMASAAQAADLLAPMAPPAAAPAPIAPTTNWQGAYVGANVGYGWGTVTSGLGTLSPSGITVGGQVGYNFVLGNNFVVGVQGDANWNDFSSSNVAYSNDIDWTGAVVGRLGFAWDAVMPYALGGVAFANNTVSSGGVTESQVQTGWTVGGGAEVMLADNLSAFAEYRYSDYGTRDYNTAGVLGVHPTDNTVRVGLNFHF